MRPEDVIAAVRRLRARFARAGNAVQTRTGAEGIPLKTVHPHWIVGRGLCLYRSEDFANVPRNRRDAAVLHRLPVWSPFQRTGHHCVFAGSTAMVWLWDADVVDPRPDLLDLDSDADPAGVRTVPETVFYPRPQAADRPGADARGGFAIQQCHEGFELQFWRNAALVDSLWQPDRPDPARIEWFVARQELTDAAADALAEPAPAAAGEPWALPVTPRAWLLANERNLVIAGLALAVAVAGFQEARHWRLHLAARAAEGELAGIDGELTPVLEARAELAALNRRTVYLAGLLDTPSQAFVMARVDRALPDPATEFRGWRYQRGELVVILGDRDLDTVATVAALQGENLFTGVQPGQAQPGGMEIRLRVDPAAARGGAG